MKEKLYIDRSPQFHSLPENRISYILAIPAIPAYVLHTEQTPKMQLTFRL